MMSSPDIGPLAKRCQVEAATEAGRDRSRHHDMAVFAPFDLERAAVELDLRLPPGEAAAARRHQRGAGAGAAGPGDADATLPDAKPQPGRRDDLRDADIGALGKDAVMLELGPQRLEIDAHD